MIIDEENIRVQYESTAESPIVAGDVLPFPYRFTEKEQLNAVLLDGTKLVYNQDYSVGETSITLSVDIPTGDTITIYRSTPLDQGSEFPQEAKFNSKKIEDALDKLTMQNQEQREALGRALKLPLTASTDLSDLALPNPDPNKSVKWNADGTALVNTDFDPDLALITTEEFKNQAQQAAIDALSSQTAAANSETIATQQANIATQQSELVASTANQALEDIDTLRTNTINELDTIVETSVETVSGLANEITNNAQNILNRLGLSLFDPVLKDHVLTYEESKGLALQGTYVYKEAIAGSRYGYPDFYNKCVEEKEAATPTETTLGDNTVTLYINSNGHRFYDIADKTAIDTWYETYGIADFYGVDTENERIFLPRNKYFMQLTDDTTKVNEMVEAGLPNITGRFGNWPRAYVTQIGTGAFTVIEAGGGYGYNTGGGVTSYSTFDASNSNSIYGNSDTVQPPSSLKLLYYVVGNTTATEALTNVTDITTSENDTLPWGYNFYSGEFLEPALGYVASIGQWLSGADWTTFYNKAVAKIGQSFAGGVIVEHTSDYTDYDLVLNQDEMTFRLPLLNGSENIPDYVNYTEKSSTGASTADKNYVLIALASLAQWAELNINVNGNRVEGVTSGATNTTKNVKCFIKKGDIYEVTSSGTNDSLKIYLYPCIGNGSLYFKLANALQNQELLDVAKVTEVFSQLTDVGAVIVDSYRDGTDGYDIYSNGDIHQWGRTRQMSNIEAEANRKIELLMPMASPDYNIQVSGLLPLYEYFYVTAYKQTTTSFYVSLVKGTDSATGQVNWHVWGKMGAV